MKKLKNKLSTNILQIRHIIYRIICYYEKEIYIVRGNIMDRLFCKGYTWGWCSRSGDYQTKAARASMTRLASNGLDWICITVNVFQETYYSTRIFADFKFTQTDEDVIHAIKMAKDMGLKVCL